MSHRDRSIANMRCEAKRIYNQRRYINKLEKDKEKLQQQNQKYKEVFDKAIEYLKDCGIDKEMMEVCSMYDVNGIEMMKILKGGEDNE